MTVAEERASGKANGRGERERRSVNFTAEVSSSRERYQL
jgi:hypothetical protein